MTLLNIETTNFMGNLNIGIDNLKMNCESIAMIPHPYWRNHLSFCVIYANQQSRFSATKASSLSSGYAL